MPFITNEKGKTLKERLKEIVPKTKQIDILVGFFYFSATEALYELLFEMDRTGKLKESHIRVLVGLDVDRSLGALYEYAIERKESIEKLLERFFASVGKALTSKQMDNKDFYNQVNFFLKLLKEGKLIIRKTRKPNHAKLYIFRLEDETLLKGFFITGSSNLTMAGLSHQEEFNVEIRDYGFEETTEYFEKLWKESVEINPSDLLEHIENRTFLKKITPFDAYLYSLKTYIDTHLDMEKENEATIRTIFEEAGYKPYTYQVEAVAQAVKIIENHGGVILGDVVGLGKTVIACAVAKRLGIRGIVIAPPHLIGDDTESYGWRKYLSDFKLHDWKVFSLGKLEEALKYVRKHGDIGLVIVDEAHRFRNESTESYAYLHEICRDKKVILLTATPFNNRPSDIFAMLKLFTIPRKSTIVFDGNLEEKFEDYENLFNKLAYIRVYHNAPSEKNRKIALRKYREIFKGENHIDLQKVSRKAHQLAREIKRTIEPVIIRRNRIDLKYYPETIPISEVKEPIEKFFELSKEQLKFYDKVVQSFQSLEEGGSFTGAIYFPERYKKDQDPETEDFTYVSQKNLYNFMRRLLVKRFESSFGAFKKSLENFLELHKKVLGFVERTNRYVMDRKLVEKALIYDDEVLELELEDFKKAFEDEKSKYTEVYDLSTMEKGEEFKKDIEKDIKLFEKLLVEFESYGFEREDPKAKKLCETVEEFLKDRKVVIFTEYKDTANYLKDILEKAFPNKVLSAIGNLSKNLIEKIQANFDASYHEPEDEYHIFLTTDKLSEGVNLNRAGVIINYDIPWNPVRVIQRVGRINRIGKKVYDELYIVNFFPTEKGSDIIRSREIAQQKMFMIHKVLGEDAKIFSPEEEPEASQLYKRLNTYMEDEEESFISKVRKEYEEYKKKYPEIFKELEKMPERLKVAKPHKENNLIVLIRKGRDLFVAFAKPEERDYKIVSFEEIYEHIRAEKDTRRLELSQDFWNLYRRILEEEKISEMRLSSRNKRAQALNVLKTIRDKYKDEISQEERDFVLKLIQDIETYSTLPKFFVEEIVSWHKLLENIEKLKEKIREMMENVNLRSYEDKLETDPTYIIAIENRII